MWKFVYFCFALNGILGTALGINILHEGGSIYWSNFLIIVGLMNVAIYTAWFTKE